MRGSIEEAQTTANDERPAIRKWNEIVMHRIGCLCVPIKTSKSAHNLTRRDFPQQCPMNIQCWLAVTCVRSTRKISKWPRGQFNSKICCIGINGNMLKNWWLFRTARFENATLDTWTLSKRLGNNTQSNSDCFIHGKMNVINDHYLLLHPKHSKQFVLFCIDCFFR